MVAKVHHWESAGNWCKNSLNIMLLRLFFPSIWRDSLRRFAQFPGGVNAERIQFFQTLVTDACVSNSNEFELLQRLEGLYESIVNIWVISQVETLQIAALTEWLEG